MRLSNLLIYSLLLGIACNSEESTSNGNEQAQNTVDEIITRPTSTRDVESVNYDFNNDGRSDGIRTITSNQDGSNKVIQVYLQSEDGYLSTFDEYENQMVFPGDSIAQISDEHFKFMYEGGDYFIFKFEVKEGYWVATQVQKW